LQSRDLWAAQAHKQKD